MLQVWHFYIKNWFFFFFQNGISCFTKFRWSYARGIAEYWDKDFVAITISLLNLWNTLIKYKTKDQNRNLHCSIANQPTLQKWVLFMQVPLHYRNVSSAVLAPIRAQIATDAPATKVEKISKKQEEGVIVNKFRPKEPYTGMCLLNTKITGDDAPGETWHMVFSTEGIIISTSWLRSIINIWMLWDW